METKKIGLFVIGLSIVAAFLVFGFMERLESKSNKLGCNPTNECKSANSLLGLSHIAIGLISFIIALGFYMSLFSRDEEAILQRLEKEKNMQLEEEKFNFVLKALDDNEKKIITAIKEQDGISQSTLRYRTDLSKAKISEVLSDFEKKNLIRRIQNGKTYSVYLIPNI